MVKRLPVIALLSALTWLGAAPGAAAADVEGDDTEITDVSGSAGSIVFAVSSETDLDLDPRSVVVEADNVVLESAADRAGDADATDDADLSLRVVYLLVDTSGSMVGEGIAAARAAGLAYLDAVPDDVRVGLVTFADEPTVVHGAASQRGPVRRALRNLQVVPDGDTALYDAIGAATSEMEALPSSADKRLLVLSDGADTASRLRQGEVTRSLAANDVTADVVAFQLPLGDEAVLNAIAAESAGSAFAAGDSAALSEAFVEVAEEMRPRLRVEADVPPELAGRTVTLSVVAQGGDRTVTTSTEVRLPDADSAGRTSGLETLAGAPTDRQLWILIALVFLAVTMVAFAALYVPVLSAQASNHQARLREVSRYRVARAATGSQPGQRRPAENSALTNRTLGFVERVMRERGTREKVGTSLESAGLRIRPEEWAVLQLAGVLSGAAACYVLTGSFIGLVLGGVVAWAGFRIFLVWRTNRRREAFLQQVPDTLQLLAGSLRAGFSLQQALSTVVREGTEPTASEFTRALTEARLGADIEDALDAVAARMHCRDLEWVVMAIRISREVGGNLAEVLSNTVSTMRERAELRGLVKVLSAEGRLSAKILLGLPFVVAIGVTLLNPDYLAPLYQTFAGWVMLGTGAILLAAGAFWLSRLVKIEV